MNPNLIIIQPSKQHRENISGDHGSTCCSKDHCINSMSSDFISKIGFNKIKSSHEFSFCPHADLQSNETTRGDIESRIQQSSADEPASDLFSETEKEETLETHVFRNHQPANSRKLFAPTLYSSP